VDSTSSRPSTGAVRGAAVLDGYRDLGPARVALAFVRDLAEMAKGGITASVVFTAAMGLWLAPARLGPVRTAVFLLATGALVGAGNILNCWIEREVDGRMHRTRRRPLPAGRLDPAVALAVASGLAAAALPAILLATNALTALLGLTALATYVAVYTPLKRLSPRALEVGGIPGAIPPLMGWAAAMGSLAAPAWALFGIMYFWQLPHFIAIALWLKEDYARGGMQVLPVARGEIAARRTMLAYTIGLVAVSLAPRALGITGLAYTLTAVVLGAVFVALVIAAVPERGRQGARRVFLYSLVYLPVLFGVLVLDAL
jgi:protoheme IX farnesyltransferase